MTNQEAITKLTNILNDDHYAWTPAHAEALEMAIEALKGADGDCIIRQAAIDILDAYQVMIENGEKPYAWARLRMSELPSAQPTVHPQRTCVNCGRTANNGGWYADGRTRCPIEEHYALPKDGYCHLWEKRNVTDDDYPERREE